MDSNKESLTLRHNQKVVEQDGNTLVTGVCVITRKEYTTNPIPRAGLIAWLMGAAIQLVLPCVSPGDREFLISGTSPEGWDTAFGTAEDDDN